MLRKENILLYFAALNEELARLDAKGEVCLYGGAVMCLFYDARPSTKDVDAVFRPATEMRQAIKRVAHKYNLKDDWLNDAVKGYVVQHKKSILQELPNLKIYVPDPSYLLAMKTLAARVDTTDKADIQFLIRLLKIECAEQVFDLLEKYYPRQMIKPATQFFVEELFEEST